LADNLFERIGKAVGISKVAPTATLGSSLTSTAELAGGVVVSDLVSSGDRNALLNLSGTKRWDEFDAMVKDVSIISAGVRMFLNLMGNAVWSVNPPDDLNENEAPVAQEYADQAYNALFDMTTSWASVVRKTAAFRLYGFAVLEWTAKRNDDGTIGFLDVEHRPQRTISKWVRDPGGSVEAVVQTVSGRGPVTIPRGKIVYAVDDVLTDDPAGTGLLRHLYLTADRLQTFIELEEVGYNTDLKGIPIARAPLGEEEARLQAAGSPESEGYKRAASLLSSKLRPLREFLNKHIRNYKTGVLLPSDTYTSKAADGAATQSSVPKWALELLNGDSSAFADMGNAVNRLTTELARILGCEHLLLGADGSGSLALAKSKVGTFYLLVTSTLQDLVEVFDRDLIEPLAELNGWPDHLRPMMGVAEVNDRDIEQIADVLQKMATAGASLMPDDPAIGEIRDMLGVSRPPEDGLAMDAALLGNQGLEASLNPDPAPADPSNPKQDPKNAEVKPGADVKKARMIRPRRAQLRKRRRA
jgi:hypothetical protein